MHRCLLPLVLALGLITSPLAGQAQVVGVRDLNFGFVIRGVQTTVAPGDPIHSGQFYLRYVAGGRMQIRFTLPTVLNLVGGGATLPITFRNGDAVAQETAPGSPLVTFNPNAVRNFRLGASPDLNLWLGGRVSPTATQVTGSYRNTLVLTVNFF